MRQNRILLSIIVSCLLVFHVMADIAANSGTPTIDDNTPPEVLIPLAESGNAKAQCLLGIRLCHGIDIEQNEEQAFQWFSRSAEQGDVVALHFLAQCYMQGVGVARDIDKSLELFHQSAEQGNPEAQYELAKMYQDVGNVEEADKWLRMAAESGHEFALKEIQIADDSTALLLVATLPVLLILCIIYLMDTRREPLGLVLKCLFLGGISVIPLIFIQEFLMTFDVSEVFIYKIAYQALVPGVTEELMKFLILFMVIWNHKEFDQYYDGIVYAVFVSLGFALVENIGYVFQYGHEAAALRAVLSIPLHCCCGVVMGYYFSYAKFSSKGWSVFYLFWSIVLPVFIHTVYDMYCFACEAAQGTSPDSIEQTWVALMGGWFMLLIVYLWCTGIRRLTALSQKDQDVLSVPRNEEERRWYAVAVRHRALLQGIFFGVIYVPAAVFLFDFSQRAAPGDNPFLAIFIFAVPYVAYAIWMTQVLYRLSRSLGNTGFVSVLWFITCFLLPFVNILLLFHMSGRARSALDVAGYRVGLMGVNLDRAFPAAEIVAQTQAGETNVPE